MVNTYNASDIMWNAFLYMYFLLILTILFLLSPTLEEQSCIYCMVVGSGNELSDWNTRVNIPSPW